MSSYSDVRPHVFVQFGSSSEADPGLAEDDLPSEPERPSFDFEALKAEAWNEAYNRGYQDGLARAEAEQRAATEQLVELAGQALVDSRELMRSLEHEVVKLSLAVAEKVIEREALTRPQIILGVVRAALEEVQEATTLTVRVHPLEIDRISENWQEVVPGTMAEHAQLVADDRVQPGGCLIETPIGQVDAQLETKLAQVTNSFYALLEGEIA